MLTFYSIFLTGIDYLTRDYIRTKLTPQGPSCVKIETVSIKLNFHQNTGTIVKFLPAKKNSHRHKKFIIPTLNLDPRFFINPLYPSLSRRNPTKSGRIKRPKWKGMVAARILRWCSPTASTRSTLAVWGFTPLSNSRPYNRASVTRSESLRTKSPSTSSTWKIRSHSRRVAGKSP